MVDKQDETALVTEERLMGHLARQEATRREVAGGGALTLEAIMARVSAEVTRAAQERKAAQKRGDH